MRDTHQRAGERHELAAQADRPAAEHEKNGDQAAESRVSERALARHILILLSVIAILAALPVAAEAQWVADSGDSSGTGASTAAAQPAAAPYVRPTRVTKIHNYLLDTLGPYPIVGAALVAGVNQVGNGPPDWKQGVEGYARRFGSDFGIAAITTTTRYALSAAFNHDAMYYRCECTGVFRRLGHAVISTLTARRGADGQTVFSVPALVAPYAGSMTAVYGWYPDRYSARDALRMGNYTMLAWMGGNIVLEFFPSGPHSLFSRMHLNSRHGAPDSGPNQ